MNNILESRVVSDQLGRQSSINSLAFQLIVISFVITQATLVYAVHHALYWLAVMLVLILSHIVHGATVGLHEATHGVLRKNRRLNEFDGHLMSVFGFISFSLYRAAHQTHHAYLATARDEELWPFVDTGKPRWFRCLMAFIELNCGLLFTPFLFYRTFLRVGSPIRNVKVRRRIWREITMMLIVWTGIFWAISHWQVWAYFLWMYVAPGFLAANMQSWRKYIEHVGLQGSTVNGSTRNIVSRTRLGRLLAYTLLHEPYHGVHHFHPGIPHTILPHYANELEPTLPDEQPVYSSYSSALQHLLHNLADPRVGAQWHRQTNLQPEHA